MQASPAKVQYVVNSLNLGGTERLVVEMSLAFADRFAVEVVCLDEPGQWAPKLRERGIPVHCVWRQPGLDLSLPRKLARLFRASGTDLIHAHQTTPWFYAALSRLANPSPRLLFEEHGRFYPEVDSVKRRLVNKAVIDKLTQRIVAVSADVRARLVRHEGLREERIDLVYNGVRPPTPLPPERRAALRQEFGFGASDFVVGTVGRFDPIKNLPLLIESLARASPAVPSLAALFVGDGPESRRVSALAAERGFGGRAVFAGFREDAREVVQCLDLFVLPSLSEGTSMALLEAMAAGVPVAVTAVGGNPEVVRAGVDGWVVPSGSVEALTEAILQAARDPDARRRFAAAGQERFRESFSFDSMISHYERIYRELLPAQSNVAAAHEPTWR